MATTVASLLSRATTLLQDSGETHWTAAEKLDWLNEGQRELCAIRQSAFPKRVTHALIAGTRQSLPADSLVLMDVTRNMSTDGTTPGAAIRLVSREILDAYVPDWHSATKTTVVKHYLYSTGEPKVFHVYPPSKGTTAVELVYGALPPDCTANGNLQVDDQYGPALLDYILYRAYSKDAEFAGAAQLAATYYQAFAAKLGVKAAGGGQ